ncbi:hypothetical protein ACF0H5_015189 [Mactra antiquata]
MADIVRSYLGSSTEYLAATGVVALSYVAFRLTLGLLKAFQAHILSRFDSIGTYFRSKGEWAVVTGATDGIGKEYASQLAQAGMNVVLISRTESKLQDVASAIESKNKVKTKIIVADFSHGPGIYDSIKAKLAGLDIGVLVNNVGLSYEYPDLFLDVPDRENVFNNLLYVNCTSVTQMSSIVLPGMVEKKKGVIINISSAAGTSPTPMLAVYSACKAYVGYLSECLDYEYNSKGIKVQCVNPYFVCSNMSKIRRASLFIPSAQTYVRNALRTVGFQTVTYGYWPHGLIQLCADCLPREGLIECKLQFMTWGREKYFGPDYHMYV